MMKLVEHPHILQLRDVFETPTHLYVLSGLVLLDRGDAS